MVEGGAVTGDAGVDMRWYVYGGYRVACQSGTEGIIMSRPFLEWHIRRRTLALSNVTLLSACAADMLVTTSDQKQVMGIKVTHRAESKRTESIQADLIVDAAGRGSTAPKWLAGLGYGRPPEQKVTMRMGYATRQYHRGPDELSKYKAVGILGTAPLDKCGGLLMPMEEDRWILTLGGFAGHPLPSNEAEFLEFARRLATPDLYDFIRRAQPLSDIITYNYPTALRRHYEKMTRFPDGYLVLGDAIASFNPIYGQGMSSAAMQVAALAELLHERKDLGQDLAGLWQPYFKRLAQAVDVPWQMAISEDFRFPETEGKKPMGTDLINSYFTRLHRTTHHDPVVCAQFYRVVNLVAPPTSLMTPKIMWRVLRPRFVRKTAVSTPQPIREIMMDNLE